MRNLCYGEITSGGQTVFRSIAGVDDSSRLVLTFTGRLDDDNPYRYLSGYLEELGRILPAQSIASSTLDFTALESCGSEGFFVVSDIADAVYGANSGRVVVRRSRGAAWQHDALPIALMVNDADRWSRTSFQDQ